MFIGPSADSSLSFFKALLSQLVPHGVGVGHRHSVVSALHSVYKREMPHRVNSWCLYNTENDLKTSDTLFSVTSP